MKCQQRSRWRPTRLGRPWEQRDHIRSRSGRVESRYKARRPFVRPSRSRTHPGRSRQPKGCRRRRIRWEMSHNSRQTAPGRNDRAKSKSGCRRVKGRPSRSTVVKTNPGDPRVVEGAGYDGKRPTSRGSQRQVETIAQSRYPCRRRRICTWIEPGDVESDWRRQSDGDGDGFNMGECQMDGATSGAHCRSKRLETCPLAEGNASQHG